MQIQSQAFKSASLASTGGCESLVQSLGKTAKNTLMIPMGHFWWIFFNKILDLSYWHIYLGTPLFKNQEIQYFFVTILSVLPLPSSSHVPHVVPWFLGMHPSPPLTRLWPISPTAHNTPCAIHFQMGGASSMSINSSMSTRTHQSTHCPAINSFIFTFHSWTISLICQNLLWKVGGLSSLKWRNNLVIRNLL